MIVTAWNDRRHATSGAGYGLRLSTPDHDRHFRREWREVTVSLPGRTAPVTVELTASFWRRCTDLRHPDIGHWLRASGYAPWPKGMPPQFVLESVEDRQFQTLVRKGR